jgi:hypothetical protein
MLNLLDDSLEAFLRAEVPLAPSDVDVSFDAPHKEWGAAVTKPTVNIFLWDVRRNLDEREAGWTIAEEDGRRVRARQKPRIDFRYLVTAWTAEVRDEHALLGSVLATLLEHGELPAEHLQGSYAPVRPLPSLDVAPPDARDQPEFWEALGGQLKPGLDMVVTATIDAAQLAETGPPVFRYRVDVSGNGATAISTHVSGTAEDAAGATVRSPRGRSVVGPDGAFLVRAEEGDEIVVESDKPHKGKVGATGGVETKRSK